MSSGFQQELPSRLALCTTHSSPLSFRVEVCVELQGSRRSYSVSVLVPCSVSQLNHTRELFLRRGFLHVTCAPFRHGTRRGPALVVIQGHTFHERSQSPAAGALEYEELGRLRTAPLGGTVRAGSPKLLHCKTTTLVTTG